MSLLNVSVVVFLLLVTFTRQGYTSTILYVRLSIVVAVSLITHRGTGSAQDVVLCSRELDCRNTFNEESVRDCCVQEGVLSFQPGVGSEICRLCYGM